MMEKICWKTIVFNYEEPELAYRYQRFRIFINNSIQKIGFHHAKPTNVDGVSEVDPEFEPTKRDSLGYQITAV